MMQIPHFSFNLITMRAFLGFLFVYIYLIIYYDEDTYIILVTQ
jgi:hypothetical protein